MGRYFVRTDQGLTILLMAEKYPHHNLIEEGLNIEKNEKPTFISHMT